MYIHGMGGGADSRIPSILSECLPAPLEVTVRTYDFDPEIAREQISQMRQSGNMFMRKSFGSQKRTLFLEELQRKILISLNN